jgi:hypothetical protein
MNILNLFSGDARGYPVIDVCGKEFVFEGFGDSAFANAEGRENGGLRQPKDKSNKPDCIQHRDGDGYNSRISHGHGGEPLTTSLYLIHHHECTR